MCQKYNHNTADCNKNPLNQLITQSEENDVDIFASKSDGDDDGQEGKV
jgi:hypothetical protein